MRETLINLFEDRMIRIVLSQPKKKDQEYQKVTLKWISDKKRSGYQVESFTVTQVFHRFVDENDLVDELVSLSEDFKQVHAFTENEEAALKISKKGKIFFATRNAIRAITGRTIRRTRESHSYSRRLCEARRKSRR